MVGGPAPPTSAMTGSTSARLQPLLRTCSSKASTQLLLWRRRLRCRRRRSFPLRRRRRSGRHLWLLLTFRRGLSWHGRPQAREPAARPLPLALTPKHPLHRLLARRLLPWRPALLRRSLWLTPRVERRCARPTCGHATPVVSMAAEAGKSPFWRPAPATREQCRHISSLPPVASGGRRCGSCWGRFFPSDVVSLPPPFFLPLSFFLFPPSPPCLSLCFAARGQRFSLGRVFISGSASAHGRWPLPRSSDLLPCSRLPGSAFGSVMFGVSSILPLPHIIHTTLHYPQCFV